MEVKERPTVVGVLGFLEFDIVLNPSVCHTGVGEGNQEEADDYANVATVHFGSV